eukprot:TRINITY_DN28311_c0_g1_i1.p1 TRINITY_DN28311_c0_g1~~TRINITY_DN28311_c0_g1_i1.p1  ORF type:complete len:334 (+),score=31.37 TRINITY_DN28311_c0_g1_i1:142-1002(+)
MAAAVPSPVRGVRSDAAVQDVLDAAQRAYGVACPGLVTFQGAVLDPATLLSDAGVTAESTLHMQTGCPFAPPAGGWAIHPGVGSSQARLSGDKLHVELVNGQAPWCSYNMLWDASVPPGQWRWTVRLRHPRETSYSCGFFRVGLTLRDEWKQDGTQYIGLRNCYMNEHGEGRVCLDTREATETEDDEDRPHRQMVETELKSPFEQYNDGVWYFWADTTSGITFQAAFAPVDAAGQPRESEKVVSSPIRCEVGTWHQDVGDNLYFYVCLNVGTDTAELLSAEAASSV